MGIIASPRAKLAAQEGNIDLKQVSGSGPNGRIIAADVIDFAKSAPIPQASVAPSATGSYTDIPTTQIRRVDLPLC